MTKELTSKLNFRNEVINKKKLQQLMYRTFHNYGVTKSSLIENQKSSIVKTR